MMWFSIKFTVLNLKSQVHVFFTHSELVRFSLFPGHRPYSSSYPFIPEMSTKGY